MHGSFAHSTGSVYRFIRRIRAAIYGEVIYAVRVIKVAGVGFMETNDGVAIKRLEKKAVANRYISLRPCLQY